MIDQEMRQVLASMELLATGGVTNYAPTGAGGIPDSRPPSGVRFDGVSAMPLHLYWRKRYEIAVERDQEATIREGGEITKARQVVLSKAQDQLAVFKKRPKVTIQLETEAELEARIVKEGRGESVERIAQHCRCTPTFVRKARLKAGVSSTTGKLPESLNGPLPKDERAEQARKMRHQEGMSIRQIAMFLKCDPMTVHRDLAA